MVELQQYQMRLSLLTRSIRWACRCRLTVLNLFGDPRVVELQLQLQQMMKNLQQMQYQEMLSKRHSNQHSTHRMQSKQMPSKQLQIYRSARKYLVTFYNVAFV